MELNVKRNQKTDQFGRCYRSEGSQSPDIDINMDKMTEATDEQCAGDLFSANTHMELHVENKKK